MYKSAEFPKNSKSATRRSNNGIYLVDPCEVLIEYDT